MRRHLFTACSALSLAACVALLLGWARAQFGDELWVRCVGHSLLLFGADGRGVRPAEGFFFDPSIDGQNYVGPSGLLRLLRSGGLYGGPVRSTRFAGVEVYADAAVAGGPPQYRAVVVPVAYPLAAAAVLPCLWAVSESRRRRRAVRGRCDACGYDLTGNASGVCPECGRESDAVKGAIHGRG
jgi:hypothetical protein